MFKRQSTGLQVIGKKWKRPVEGHNDIGKDADTMINTNKKIDKNANIDTIKDYGWKKPKTCVHDLLLKTIEKILFELNIPKNTQILDAGCGGGYVMHELYTMGYKNIWGFDVSESGINVAKENYRDTSNNLKVHNAYNSELPSHFPQKGYDIILSVEVIEHMFSPKEYMKNVSLWLKENGFLILTTPYHGYLKNLLISLLNKSDTHFNPLNEVGHIKFFSKKTLYTLFQEHGFKTVKFYGSGRIPYLWKAMVVVAQKIRN